MSWDALNLVHVRVVTSTLPPFLLQLLGRHQVHSSSCNCGRVDPGHLPVSRRPVADCGPTAATSAGSGGERDRLPAGTHGGAGHVGHNVCLRPPQEGGAVLCHRQV